MGCSVSTRWFSSQVPVSPDPDGPPDVVTCSSAMRQTSILRTGKGQQVSRRPARVLAFVAAHPDDDVMGAAGIIAKHRDDPGLRFVLVHATDGEAGEIAPGSGATRERLGVIRREEDHAGWRVVGRMPDRHEWLGLPDGGVDAVADGLLADRLTDIFEQERPDVVLSAGPDGVSGHADHIAVGRAATTAFLRFAGDGGPGFRRLLHAAVPQTALDRINARLLAAGRRPYDPTRMYDLRGVPDDQIACTVDLREHVPLIRAAFREHRTQWAPPWTDHSPQDWTWAAGASHFVMAWPQWVPGTVPLTDVLQDL